MDRLGAAASTQSAINIHGGKRGSPDRLVKSILALPDNVRSRLTLENDENCWSVKDLMPISAATGVPVLFDSHHHTFNDGGLPGEEAMLAAASTWPQGILPLQHISNTEPGLEGGNFTERRAHSWAIHTIPDYQKKVQEYEENPYHHSTTKTIHSELDRSDPLLYKAYLLR
jgi:UV DNA damage endonuclease